eukprot:jgi/Bigna1/80283/fgenesh1_pg.69_\
MMNDDDDENHAAINDENIGDYAMIFQRFTCETKVIKFVYATVDIDLSFCQLALNTIPDDWNPLDDRNLQGLGKKSQKSLNGPRKNKEKTTFFPKSRVSFVMIELNGIVTCNVRDTDSLLTLVPKPDTFRLVLRFIKMWAQNRAVYSNVFGYFGGIAWAICSAQVCQWYPNAAPGIRFIQIFVCICTIICVLKEVDVSLMERHGKFFLVLNHWKWPSPIRLTNPDRIRELKFEVWDPLRNKKDLAPIITPSYPPMNSTFNVNKSTLAVLKKELMRGEKISSRLMNENLGTEDILKVSRPEDEDEFNKYYGFVQSKMRQLVLSLEPPYMFGVQCTPYPKAMEHPDQKCVKSFFLGLDFKADGEQKGEGASKGKRKQVDIRSAITYFKGIIEKYNGEGGFKCEFKHVTATKLPEWVFPDEKRPAPSKKRKRRKKSSVPAIDKAAIKNKDANKDGNKDANTENRGIRCYEFRAIPDKNHLYVSSLEKRKDAGVGDSSQKIEEGIKITKVEASDEVRKEKKQKLETKIDDKATINSNDK